MTPEQIAVQFEHHHNEIASLKHRMKKCEEQQDTLQKMALSMEKMAINLDFIRKEQTEQGERLARLEHEPAEEFKHYKRLIIGCIVTGVLSCLLGAVLALIIKGGV